jgi:outer membrane protein TolC
MKAKLSYLLTILLVAGSLFASYPNLDAIDEEYDFNPSFSSVPLDTFLAEWNRSLEGVTLQRLYSELPARLASFNADLAQLESVVQLQQAQLDFSLAQAKTRLSLQATPYSYSDTTVFSAGNEIRTKRHSFSVSSSLAQALPTAGSVSVTASQSSAYSINMTPSNEAWSHTPQISVQLQQPLWIGERIIDASYQKAQLEKQQLSLNTANLSKDALKEALIIQNLSLINLNQALKEARFILQGRAALAASNLKIAESDFEAGLISRQSLERTKLGYYQILSTLNGVQRELDELQITMGTVWEGTLPDQIVLSDLDPFSLASLFDDPQLLGKYLISDPTYQQALKELSKAMIDGRFSELSDAVQLSLSLQLSPFYTPTANSSFFNSFDEMFRSSHPVVSFSIGLSASDLFRRTSSFRSETSRIAIEQANLSITKAREEAETALRAMRTQLQGYLLDLLVQLEDYTLVQMQWETEQIRFDAKLVDQNALKAKQLDWYQAAFDVLQTLRNIELLQLRMQGRQLM